MPKLAYHRRRLLIPVLWGSSYEALPVHHRQPAGRRLVCRCRLRRSEGIKRSLGERALHPDARRPADLDPACRPPHEARRAFWIGFALFGWSYLGLSLVPSIESRLMTTKALAYLDSKVPGRSLRLFTVRLTGTCLGLAQQPSREFAFTADGNELAASGQSGVRLWDVATGRLLSGWSWHNRELHSDRTLAVCSAGGLVWRAAFPPSLPLFEIARVIHGGMSRRDCSMNDPSLFRCDCSSASPY